MGLSVNESRFGSKHNSMIEAEDGALDAARPTGLQSSSSNTNVQLLSAPRHSWKQEDSVSRRRKTYVNIQVEDLSPGSGLSGNSKGGASRRLSDQLERVLSEEGVPGISHRPGIAGFVPSPLSSRKSNSGGRRNTWVSNLGADCHSGQHSARLSNSRGGKSSSNSRSQRTSSRREAANNKRKKARQTTKVIEDHCKTQSCHPHVPDPTAHLDVQFFQQKSFQQPPQTFMDSNCGASQGNVQIIQQNYNFFYPSENSAMEAFKNLMPPPFCNPMELHPQLHSHQSSPRKAMNHSLNPHSYNKFLLNNFKNQVNCKSNLQPKRGKRGHHQAAESIQPQLDTLEARGPVLKIKKVKNKMDSKKKRMFASMKCNSQNVDEYESFSHWELEDHDSNDQGDHYSKTGQGFRRGEGYYLQRSEHPEADYLRVARPLADKSISVNS